MAWGFSHQPLADEELAAMIDAAADHGDILDEAVVEGLAVTGMRIGEWTHMDQTWFESDADELRIAAIKECDCGECRRERLEPLLEARETVRESDKAFGDWKGVVEDGKVVNRYAKYARRDGIGKARLDFYLDNADGVWWPKSETSARVIPVPDEDVLEKLEWALELHGRDEENQWPITRHGTSKRIKKLAERAGLDSIHAHRWRHHYGTRMAQDGFSAHEIKEAMGHSELDQSLTYVQFSGRRLRQSFAEKWSGIGDD